jgi:heat shock protein HslJ
MSNRWIVLLPLVALVLAACGDDGGAETTPLEGTTWTLVRVDGTDAVPDATAQLTLEDGQASGSSGCNSFSGGYTLDGDQISFGPLGATQMACEEPLMTQEATVFAILGTSASYAIEGDELTISSPEGSLVYRAEA